MNGLDSLVGALVGLLILLGLFLLVRNFWLWLFGITAIQQELREQTKVLHELAEAHRATNLVLGALARHLILSPEQEAPQQPPAA